MSAIAAGHRYGFGVAGAAVDGASVSLSGAAARRGRGPLAGATAVQPPVDPGAASDAGLPAGDGWFVLFLGPVAHGAEACASAVVNPLTRHGHRAGPPYVDCSLGVLSPACRQRIDSPARR